MLRKARLIIKSKWKKFISDFPDCRSSSFAMSNDDKSRKNSGNNPPPDVTDGGDKSPSKSQRKAKLKEEQLKHHFQV